jgi:hypothetical protein
VRASIHEANTCGHEPTTTEPHDVLDIKGLAALLLTHRVTTTLKAQAGEIPSRAVIMASLATSA